MYLKNQSAQNASKIMQKNVKKHPQNWCVKNHPLKLVHQKSPPKLVRQKSLPKLVRQRPYLICFHIVVKLFILIT